MKKLIEKITNEFNMLEISKYQTEKNLSNNLVIDIVVSLCKNSKTFSEASNLKRCDEMEMKYIKSKLESHLSTVKMNDMYCSMGNSFNELF